MSISYQQMDEEAPQLSRASMTEYDRRKLLAKKSMDDAVRKIERIKSLDKGSTRPTSPRAEHNKGGHPLPLPLPASEENEDKGGGKGEPAAARDWWKRTDQAFLNDKPEKALSDESTNSQFLHQTYVPQYEAAGGAHVPEYMKSPSKKAQREVRAV